MRGPEQALLAGPADGADEADAGGEARLHLLVEIADVLLVGEHLTGDQERHARGLGGVHGEVDAFSGQIRDSISAKLRRAAGGGSGSKGTPFGIGGSSTGEAGTPAICVSETPCRKRPGTGVKIDEGYQSTGRCNVTRLG